LPGGGGVGGAQIPTRGIHCGTLYMYVLCARNLSHHVYRPARTGNTVLV
jgi:hypothetical protein